MRTVEQHRANMLQSSASGTSYELPPFYEVHTWVWKHNPGWEFAITNRG